MRAPNCATGPQKKLSAVSKQPAPIAARRFCLLKPTILCNTLKTALSTKAEGRGLGFDRLARVFELWPRNISGTNLWAAVSNLIEG